jgi:RNA polymerase sigma-70 factor (ECF subfamily)
MTTKTVPDFADRLVALRPKLLRQATRWLCGRSQLGSPEDLVQDTIVIALQNADRYADDNLAGWLVTILHGHVRNAGRRARIRTSMPLSGPDASADGDDGERMIEVPAAATQDLGVEVRDVLAALQALPAIDQEIIRLSRLADLTQDEIAARLAMPPGTLASRLFRATARLRSVCGCDDPALIAKPLAGPARRTAA